EKSGFEYGLTQIRFASSYGAENQHESFSFSHALLAQTSKINLIAAILPRPGKPTHAAKQLARINQLLNGRLAITVVSGWLRGESDAIGEAWQAHHPRFDCSEGISDCPRAISNIYHLLLDRKMQIGNGPLLLQYPHLDIRVDIF